MNIEDKMKYFSFMTSSRKHKLRRVVPLNLVLKELKLVGNANNS